MCQNYRSLSQSLNIILVIIAVELMSLMLMSDVAVDYLIILLMLCIILVAFVSRANSDKAAEGLKQMVANKTDVIRDGKLVEIDIADVVRRYQIFQAI